MAVSKGAAPDVAEPDEQVEPGSDEDEGGGKRAAAPKYGLVQVDAIPPRPPREGVGRSPEYLGLINAVVTEHLKVKDVEKRKPYRIAHFSTTTGAGTARLDILKGKKQTCVTSIHTPAEDEDSRDKWEPTEDWEIVARHIPSPEQEADPDFDPENDSVEGSGLFVRYLGAEAPEGYEAPEK